MVSKILHFGNNCVTEQKLYISDAIKVSFDGDRAPRYEVNDKFIAQAVKDWLKLSKQRQLNKRKEN